MAALGIAASFLGLLGVALIMLRASESSHRRQRGLASDSSDLIGKLTAGREWLWAVNADGVFTFSSSAVFDLLGYQPDELVGQYCSRVMDPQDLAALHTAAQSFTGRESGWARRVIACRHQDGGTTWVEVSGRPRHDPAGRVIGFDGSGLRMGPESAHGAAAERTRNRIEAILADRLLLTAFQPIFGLDTTEVVGAEALTRFVADPAVSPEVWFADATSVGLGAELELLAVATALKAATELPEHLYVTVNASPATCLDPRLFGVLRQGPIDTNRLVIELTEHIAVADYGPLEVALRELRSVGVRIAVDDVGAGFASFLHILRLKPSLLKLDRGIVAGIDTDPARQALGAAMATFAAQTGATVIAEGIETSAELATVTKLGMAAGQGYLLGRPSLQPREWAAWQRTPAPR